MVSKELQMVIKVLRKNQVFGKSITIEQTRKFLDRLTSSVQPPKDVQVESIKTKNIPAEWLSTPDSNNDKVIFYLHGGGYVSGSINTHRSFVGVLSKRNKCRCLIIDYRLAPENPFPAALEDSINIYKWLLDEIGINPKNLIIAGESAGGGLTLATTLKIKELDLPLPAACMVFSPWADLANTGETIKTKKDEDPFITPQFLVDFSKMYYANHDPKTPYISPLYGDYNGFPPLLIQVGTAEVLLSDAIRVTERAKKAGVNVILEEWEEMIHAFQLFGSFVPEGKDAMEKIAEFVNKVFYS